jgi:hypothetical protein
VIGRIVKPGGTRDAPDALLDPAPLLSFIWVESSANPGGGLAALRLLTCECVSNAEGTVLDDDNVNDEGCLF